MAKHIRFFLIVDDKKNEQESAIAAIRKTYPNCGEATTFGSYERRGCWWFHMENDTDFIVVWLAKDIAGFAEMFKIGKAQIALGVVKREDVLILTDLMFPLAEGRPPMPNGISVVLSAIAEDIVVSVCSDTNHHDAQFFTDLHPILSEKAAYRIPYGTDEKNWESALQGGLKVQEEFKAL